MNAERLSPIGAATSASKAYPNPDDPQPPGPWDPYISQAFEKVFGPFPEPWRWSVKSRRLGNLARIKPAAWDGINPLESVALNPQPLPPRWAIAIEFVRRAGERLVAIQETADVIVPVNGSERGIIVVGGKISELVEFVCGTPWRKWPVPGLDPDPRLSATELLLAGAEFVNVSEITTNERLAGELAEAGRKLIYEGLERL
jgi:hypothetical protein